MDGVSLEGLVPGAIREVSMSVGTWLMAQGYAELEMRQQAEWPEGDQKRASFTDVAHVADDRRRRSR